MVRKSLLTLLFVIFTLSLFAQTDFRNGYIITNDNDTIYGLIDYRSDYLNCSKCVFKNKIEEEPIIYLPEDIRAYRFIDDKYYISFYIHEFGKKVFLEYLINGIVDIYFYQDGLTQHFYISKEGSELIELNNDEKEIIRNGVKYLKASNEYIGVLKYLLQDSKNVYGKIDNLSLNTKSLINIANEYHHDVCPNEECSIYEKKIPPLKFIFDGILLANSTRISINSIDYKGFKYKSDLSFDVGLGTSIYFPLWNKRFSVYYQLVYSRNSFYDSYYKNVSAEYNYSTLKLNYLNSSLGLKYRFPERKYRPEFVIAWVNNIKLGVSSERTVEVENPDNIIQTYYYTEKILNTSYNGIMLGGAIKVYQFSNYKVLIYMQYNYFFENDDVSLNSLKLGLGIQF